MIKDSKDLDKWDSRFLNLAYHVSTWSKDPSTQVGAVITGSDHRIISLGFNGFPKGLKDTYERLENRETKYGLVVHAEMNALLFANRSVEEGILYTYPLMPCQRCAVHIIQRGIKRVVAPYSENPRWVESFRKTEEIFSETGIELILVKEFNLDFKKY